MEHSAPSSGTRYEVYDTVLLVESSPPLVGTVERTYANINSHEPVRDCLIVSHVPVPPLLVRQLILSGIPPRGFLFVQWARLEYGWSLVAENDVVLLDRLFSLGDTVKRHPGDAMSGMVTSVNSRYQLDPIFPVIGTQEDCVKNPFLFTQERSQPLLNVPGEDLKRAEDFEDGDHIIKQDRFGLVENSEPEVVIRLQNGTVVQVSSPWQLELVVPNFDGHIVTFPEIDNINRPDFTSTQHGVTSICPDALLRGQFVVTNHKNLRNGRWLFGEYDPSCNPCGHILDVRTICMNIRWLCPNAFNPTASVSNISLVRPYDNLSSFRDPRDIRRNKHLTLYNHQCCPSPSASGEQPISTGPDYHVGDQVRFKTAKAITSEASKMKDTSHNEEDHRIYRRIPRENSYNFDVNEFVITSMSQQVTVLWQDGTTATFKSIDLTPSLLPEADLSPGDVVTAKEGLKQIPLNGGAEHAIDFNEMSFFEQESTLRPQKVGVIQSVNSAERLANVRWFIKPEIELQRYGRVLGSQSQFGPIGEVVEDVSLYEIMSHAALVRRRQDIVLIPPVFSRSELSYDDTKPLANPMVGPTTLTQVRADEMDLPALLQVVARPHADNIRISTHQVSNQRIKTRSKTCDWIGEIIDVGLDGLVTVRLGALNECQDVRLSHEKILLVIDQGAEYMDMNGDMGDTMSLDPHVGLMNEHLQISEEGEDEEDLEDDSGSAIDEVVEYDGGQRIDNDSGDEMWTTDEEIMPDSSNTSMDKDVVDHNVNQDEVLESTNIFHSELLPVSAPSQKDAAHSKTDSEPSNQSILYGMLGDHAPPGFQILDDDPPYDQFRGSEAPSTTGSILKRIRREHVILSSSLPVGEIYVRTYESRLDLLRCLLIGPKDSPYEFAPFLIDLHLGPDFPQRPPSAYFHSWTSGLGRINPNLYEEGKICLSLLGTWPGKTEQEGWTENATILQLLVSLQGLVFVSKPFYNEAGFELHGADNAYALESLQYSEKAFVMARGFVKHAMINPIFMLEDVLAWLYLPATAYDGETQPAELPHGLLPKVIDRALALIQESERMKAESKEKSIDNLVDGAGVAGDATTTFLQPLSQGAIVMLRKTVQTLQVLLGTGMDAS